MDQIRQIKAITFDGDMTLWDFEKVMRHSLAITLKELRHRLPGRASSDLTIEKMIEIRNTVENELKGKVINLEEIRLHAFKRTVEFLGHADNTLAGELNALYLKHRFEDTELYPDVIPTLDSLLSDFVVGLVSNGNGYPEKVGLTDRFSFVVFSQDIGIAKPDTGIFLEACRRAGCFAKELIHVGDSLESDVSGANSAGAVSVWLNRQGLPNNSDIVPDFEIRSLAELSGILK